MANGGRATRNALQVPHAMRFKRNKVSREEQCDGLPLTFQIDIDDFVKGDGRIPRAVGQQGHPASDRDR